MRPSRFFNHSVRSLQVIFAAAILLGIQALPAVADAPKSLLPAFGEEGKEFNVKAKDGNVVHGWLPNDWTDNSDWAPVSATYTKLTDSPDKAASAVRIKVEKVEEGGQLQLTTYQGNQKYKKGTKYVLSGWIRSADHISVKVGTRQMGEPYEFYHEEDLAPESEWKHFEFTFTPMMDFQAFIMFIVHDPGTVDLAGIALEEKP